MVCITEVRALSGAGNYLLIFCRLAMGSFNVSAVKASISKTRWYENSVNSQLTDTPVTFHSSIKRQPPVPIRRVWLLHIGVLLFYGLHMHTHSHIPPPTHTHIYKYIYVCVCVWSEEVLRVKEQRNILHEISKRGANWIGHILCRNCLLQRVIEGKIKGG
jgi:uncharacterized membrane protein YgdD (TMEM256/DUF423 family)